MADTTVSFDFDTLGAPGETREAAVSVQDRELIEGLQAGVEEAYEYLIQQFQQPVYSLVYRLTDDSGDASDIVQEVFLKVFRHIGSFRNRSSLKTWIYRIAVNEAHNHRRWFGRHRKREVGLETEDGAGNRTYGDVLPNPGRSPFEEALHDETMRLVKESLATIKPVFREAVVLRDLEDMSYEEIKEVLQVSLGTVKSRILRGREALREELTRRLERAEGIGWTPRTAEQD